MRFHNRNFSYSKPLYASKTKNMKKIILTLLTLLFITNIFSQTEFNELNEYLKNIENVSQLKDLKYKKFNSFSVLDVIIETDRKVDFGFNHNRILIIPSPGEDLKINIISKNDSIIFGNLAVINMRNHKIRDSKNFKESDLFLKKYIKDHNEFYKTDLNSKEFTEQLLGEYVVGFSCGEVGLDIPKESKKINSLINNNATNILRKLLRSFSPELQSLGTIGLTKLNTESEKDKIIIEYLKKRNTMINSCLGCIYGFIQNFEQSVKFE